LLTVIKYIVWVDTRGESGKRGPGWGRIWAADRKHGTSMLEILITSPITIARNVLWVLELFFLCSLKRNHETEYLFLVLSAR
jgi:hypothetical protein